MFVNNLRIFWPSKILLITLDQVQLKSVRAKFHADRTKSQGGVWKSRFSSFCNFATGSGRGHRKVIQLHSGNLTIQGFWMCDLRCGSYRQKRVFLGYSALCRRIYVVLCVWDIRRSLDQPSRLHRAPLHGLACSTTFSRRKIKIKIFTITIGFLAPLVLGNAYACRIRSWPPNTQEKQEEGGGNEWVTMRAF